ncbi:unnamed protein product [Arabidopsis thaliana]|uniref:Uncharacterized protein n=1 Tax=Arabidopsis thaliana TaxID=3702 RepID=A0A654G5K8_ARATH|nr:unnamed protein product [Arabidopsis thaliana]
MHQLLPSASLIGLASPTMLAAVYDRVPLSRGFRYAIRLGNNGIMISSLRRDGYRNFFIPLSPNPLNIESESYLSNVFKIDIHESKVLRSYGIIRPALWSGAYQILFNSIPLNPLDDRTHSTPFLVDDHFLLVLPGTTRISTLETFSTSPCLLWTMTITSSTALFVDDASTTRTLTCTSLQLFWRLQSLTQSPPLAGLTPANENFSMSKKKKKPSRPLPFRPSSKFDRVLASLVASSSLSAPRAVPAPLSSEVLSSGAASPPLPLKLCVASLSFLLTLFLSATLVLKNSSTVVSDHLPVSSVASLVLEISSTLATAGIPEHFVPILFVPTPVSETSSIVITASILGSSPVAGANLQINNSSGHTSMKSFADVSQSSNSDRPWATKFKDSLRNLKQVDPPSF